MGIDENSMKDHLVVTARITHLRGRKGAAETCKRVIFRERSCACCICCVCCMWERKRRSAGLTRDGWVHVKVSACERECVLFAVKACGKHGEGAKVVGE